MSQLSVVVGGQYGSEAKGHVAAFLGAEHPMANIGAVRIAGPNAGHTAIKPDSGTAVALRQIPVVAVTNPACQLFIAAGSEIEPAVLMDEISMLEDIGIPIRNRLLIDAQATVIEEPHKIAEGGNDGALQKRLGSTGKGVGAARADRIWRKALLWENVAHKYGLDKTNTGNVTEHLRLGLRQDAHVIIEGTQGYGLGLHAGHYPFCTSSDCRAIDFLAMAGISPWDTIIGRLDIWVVLRTFPIRVAGNSGPMHDEIDWATLAAETNGHVQEERTTVTRKVRRVGRWDARLAREAVIANGGYNVKIALMFADYIDPTIAGTTDPSELSGSQAVESFIERVQEDCRAEVLLVGTGPGTMVDLRKN